MRIYRRENVFFYTYNEFGGFKVIMVVEKIDASFWTSQKGYRNR